MDMITKIENMKKSFDSDLKSAKGLKELEDLRQKYLSRKGQLAILFDDLKNVSPREKPQLGKSLNALKNHMQEGFNSLLNSLQLDHQRSGRLDLSLPGRKPFSGRKHPLTATLDEMKMVFTSLGFWIEDGPEIETDYYNFEALNIPKNHPARDMQDTLYISEDVVLRTHTSPVQIRVMEKRKPPVRIIAPGRVYRRDTPDASHSPFFHQVEGLVVDEGISFGDLKGVITAFAHKMFGEDTRVRFRPSFFPFTEPSAEYDFLCIFCRGKGCRVCKNTGWVEISGAGMVDPNVFAAVGYDSEKYTGYAFGMGVDRIAMLKYGINDIRIFFENDMRFLNQF
jgi:phenylalanyl-tRNA synthetase alpha chain